MKICPRCRHANPDDAEFCGQCSANLQRFPGASSALERERPLREQISAAIGDDQQVSLSIPLVVGVIGLLAVVCLLVMIIVGLVGDRTSEISALALGIVPTFIRLYAFLLALLGSYVLISRMDLSQFFSPVKGWMRFLLLVMMAELLYRPLSFIFDRVFTFVSKTTHIAYSLERLAEGGFLIAVLAGVFWMLKQESK